MIVLALLNFVRKLVFLSEHFRGTNMSSPHGCWILLMLLILYVAVCAISLVKQLLRHLLERIVPVIDHKRQTHTKAQREVVQWWRRRLRTLESLATILELLTQYNQSSKVFRCSAVVSVSVCS